VKVFFMFLTFDCCVLITGRLEEVCARSNVEAF
jgi:hypothetical protein